MVSAEVWLVAEVAVTVMELVPGGVPCCVTGTLLLPPPQLPRRSTNAMVANTRASFLVLMRRNPVDTSRAKPATKANSQNRGPGCCLLSGTAAEGAVVVTVRTVDTGLTPGMRVAGEKLQLEAAGSPLHEKPTVEVMSPLGLMVMLNVAVCPALMVALCGEAAMLKSAGTEVRISSTSVAEEA